MLSIQSIDKSYGPQILFEKATLQLTPGERLGLVGRNGHGKSTLFRLILGEEEVDAGLISTPRNYRMGHLAQHLHFTKPTILEEVCLGLLPDEEHDHYKAERILFGLGFNDDDMSKPPAQFSGGFQVRLNLAKVLVSNPNLLLLDEPTNYLDIISIRWLTKFLRGWENELIIISHDRQFMDSVTTHTALIHRRNIRKVEGNTAKLYNLVAQEEETYEKTRQNEEKQRKHAQAFIDRFRAQAGRAAMVQSRVKRLEKMPELEALSRIQDLDFEFHYAPITAKTLMDIKDLSFSYTPEIPLIPKFDLMIMPTDRIAIIGKNGKGKSTLLNLLAGEIKPLTGTIYSHPDRLLGYFGQTNISRLDPKLTVEDEVFNSNPKLGKTEVRGICGLMMFSGDQAEKKISHLSGGEKSRVLLGKILAQPANLLFLDEPTNHLDMQSIEALIESIQNFEGACLIVTHSEEILRQVATKLIIFNNDTVEVFNGDYDDFLRQIGWEEEGGKVSKTKKVVKPVNSTSDQNNGSVHKKSPQDIEKEKNKILAPIQKEMTTLEGKIAEFEAAIAAGNEELIKVSQSKNRDAFVTISKRIKESKKEIDSCYAQYEKLTQKYIEIEAKYASLLE